MKLDQWLKNPGADKYAPIIKANGCVGIHDVGPIEQVRTYLWDLSDYFVSSVSGGVIWLVPKA